MSGYIGKGTPVAVEDGSVEIDDLSATGTPSSTTFLRGDNSWTTVDTDLVSDTSPQLGGDLDANGKDISGTGKFVASSTSTGDYVRMYGSTGTGKWDIYGNGANLRFSDNETAGSVVFDTSVGIGTSSPSTKLDVQGALSISNSAASYWTIDRNDDNGTLHIADSGVNHLNLDVNGNVGIGTSSPFSPLHLGGAGSASPSTSGNMANNGITISNGLGGRAIQIGVDDTNARSYIQAGYVNNSNVSNHLSFLSGATESMRITSDGRGLSQFTAKAWVHYDQSTNTIDDSHNISSATDSSTGNFKIHFTNNMANSTYCPVSTAGGIGGTSGDESFNVVITGGIGTSYTQFRSRHRYTSSNTTDNILNAIVWFGD